MDPGEPRSGRSFPSSGKKYCDRERAKAVATRNHPYLRHGSCLGTSRIAGPVTQLQRSPKKPSMRKRLPNSAKVSLAGTWRCVGNFGSSVEYRVRKQGSGYRVKARDTKGGERADIFSEKWDPRRGVLSFAAHWNSTGRLVRCRLQMTSVKKLASTSAPRDADVLVRQEKKG